MARIAINGISARSGGGKSVLRNLLGALRAMPRHDYVVFVPAGYGYETLAADNIAIRPIEGAGSPLALLRFNLRTLPRLLREERSTALFNPADVIVPTTLPQVFLFDWPYAAFPKSPAWHRSGARDYLVRRVKLMLFRRSLHHVDIMVAQSATMRERLAQLYRIPDIEVVENAVSLDNLAQGESHDFALGDGFKFLCLSVYYTHKNIEIFLPVARAIKARGLGFKIVTTIAPEQHAGAAAFLANVAAEELDDVIVNVGPVSMELVPALFRQCNALLLPTLLESFSGTYVEAMFHGLPIVTSDLDFATGVCHDAAWYFDPCDAASVLAQMVDVSTDPKRRAARVTRGRTILAGLPNWHEAARRLEAMFDRVAAAAARAGHDRETQ